MDFLDRFNPRDRDRLSTAATTLRLTRGQILFHRGEKGRDLYRVVEGELEVIDSRAQPAVVLSVLGRGMVVGEMSFMDESVRSADVRAADLAVCQRWDRAALLRLLDQDPDLGAAFYRVLARMLSERTRSLNLHAVAGTLVGGQNRAPGQASSAEGLAIAEAVRTRLVELEPLLRRDREGAERDLLAALHNFSQSLHTVLGRMTEEDAVATGEVVARELHPYVMRSHIGESLLNRAGAPCGGPPTIARLHDGRPGGDGPIGEVLDAWLLSLPTARAFRERRSHAAQLVMEALPAEPPVRIMVVNSVDGALVSDLAGLCGRARGEMLILGESRENLAIVDAAVPRRPHGLKLRLVQEDFTALCLGRSASTYQPQHILVLDALLEYMPERIGVALLRWARAQLAPGGALVATALAPSPDDAVFRHLLGWPLIRRAKPTIAGLLGAAGFEAVRVWDAGTAGLVASARAQALESSPLSE